MDTNFSPLSHLSPQQHQALYEHARREAHALRALVQALVRAKVTQAKTLDAAGYAELAGIYAEVLAQALSLAKNENVAPPAAAVDVTSALARGEVVEALSLASGAVLAAGRHPAWRPRAGLVAAVCVALFIAIEAPVSGMSLNPARTLASAVWAGEFTGLWIYFLAPALGMLLAAEVARHSHPMSQDSPCGITT